MKCKWIAFLLLAASAVLSAQSRFVRAEGKYLVAPDGKHLMLRGTSIGNWLEPEGYMFGFEGGPQAPREIEEFFNELIGPEDAAKFWHRYRDTYITEEDIKFLRDTGSNSIRIPFHYKFFVPGNEEGLARLDKVVGWAHKYGLYVILDMHGAPGGQSTDHCTGHRGKNQLWLPKNRERTAFLWKKIAQHYRTSATVAAYDLLNEPFGDYRQEPSDSVIVATMDQLIHAVREVDQRHLIFCAGSMRGIAMYGAPASRGWKNVGYTEHFYPGVYDSSPTLETHARFLSRDLRENRGRRQRLRGRRTAARRYDSGRHPSDALSAIPVSRYSCLSASIGSI